MPTVNDWFYACSLDVTDGGLAAIVRLVNGDLRKALNILQVFALFRMFWADRGIVDVLSLFDWRSLNLEGLDMGLESVGPCHILSEC